MGYCFFSGLALTIQWPKTFDNFESWLFSEKGNRIQQCIFAFPKGLCLVKYSVVEAMKIRQDNVMDLPAFKLIDFGNWFMTGCLIVCNLVVWRVIPKSIESGNFSAQKRR